MALIVCKDCKAQISSDAKYCIKCGARKPIRWGNLFLTAAGVVIVAFLVIPKDNPQPQHQAVQKAQSQPSPTETTPHENPIVVQECRDKLKSDDLSNNVAVANCVNSYMEKEFAEGDAPYSQVIQSISAKRLTLYQMIDEKRTTEAQADANMDSYESEILQRNPIKQKNSLPKSAPHITHEQNDSGRPWHIGVEQPEQTNALQRFESCLSHKAGSSILTPEDGGKSAVILAEIACKSDYEVFMKNCIGERMTEEECDLKTTLLAQVALKITHSESLSSIQY